MTTPMSLQRWSKQIFIFIEYSFGSALVVVFPSLYSGLRSLRSNLEMLAPKNSICIMTGVPIKLFSSNKILFNKAARPIPFRKRSLPFLTVDATISNQAFSHDRCNTFPGLSFNKQNNTFLNSLQKNDVEAEVEFTFKVVERARFTCHWCVR